MFGSMATEIKTKNKEEKNSNNYNEVAQSHTVEIAFHHIKSETVLYFGTTKLQSFCIHRANTCASLKIHTHKRMNER